MSDDTTPVKSAHGLYAKIGLDFPDDPKVIEAGAYAELAYLRCTLHAKANRSDGKIHRLRLSRWLAGIPGKPEKHMDRLVAVGLLEVHADGWAIPERVWRRWNKTAEEIDEVRVQKQEAAAKGNHVRHHVEKGITRGDCPYCEHQPIAQSSHSAKPQREVVVADPSPKTESETEVETKTSSSSGFAFKLKSVDDELVDDDDGLILKVMDKIVAERVRLHNPRDPLRYRRSVVQSFKTEEMTALKAYVVEALEAGSDMTAADMARVYEYKRTKAAS